MIYLEGGGNCATSADCADRYATQSFYMSSKSLQDGAVFTTMLDGIKSVDAAVNPDFWDATYVQLVYCSSDFWSGDHQGDSQKPTSDVGRWSFRGRKIVEAVTKDLQSLGLGTAEEVLFTGSSAGGVGVMMNVDDLRAALPKKMRLVAMADASFGIDYPAYDPSTKLPSTASPNLSEIELTGAVAVWGGHGDASCEAAAGDEFGRMLCRFPAPMMLAGNISTPLYVRQSQRDVVQLKAHIDPKDKSPEAVAYRDGFAAKMRKDLSALQPLYSAFSTNDNHHGDINDSATWTGDKVGGVTLSSAFGAWYADPCGKPTKLIQGP
jgi:hypothetical protein